MPKSQKINIKNNKKLKRTIFFKRLFSLLFASFLFLTGCKKEEKEAINLVGCWTAIDENEGVDYYTLTFNSNSTFTLRINYGNQNSNDYKIYSGSYKYSTDMMYFWLEAVWVDGGNKAQTAFKIYSFSNNEMTTSAFYAYGPKFTWIRN